ncbi:glycosyltransferase family 2 protein [Streptomyces sp. SL13]|uniref:Glycosyltransferase family 2 protein n=1 Tax=Streptantibioticus silvisoli TaxID=2705255 RepID=A0AA90H8V2_9ACTN|nr:glycosyltransferase family 2 protein [Streptantibioticus silvisoli]MDI5973013.1 glycosyltransferase family 2 protein [Streptantibioticus silvisoli]
MSVHSQQGAYSAPAAAFHPAHQAAFGSAHPPEFRRHIVTAVLVAHDGARWLPAALAGLLGQERPVQDVVAADTGSGDDSARLLTEALGDQRVLHLARRTGFGAAVAEAVRAVPPVSAEDLPYLQRPSAWDPVTRTWNDEVYDQPQQDPDDTVQWLWLLHDDCEPAPDALGELLRVADSTPSATVVGPKVRSWYDRRALLEVGVSIARSGRRWTGLERREQDQGQHDQVRQVLSVSSAGMLVRRDVWEQLGGFDRHLPLMRDDVDFCWRAQAAGHTVLIAPDAVLRHAEAASRERRTVDCAGRSAQNPHRVDKSGAVFTLLTNTRGALLPYVLLRIVIGTLLRTLGYLVGKVPGQALDEVAGLAAVLLRPERLLAARRDRGRPVVAPADLRQLFPPPGATIRVTAEQVYSNLAGRSADETSSAGRHGSALESGPGDDADFLEIEQFARLRRIARKPGPVLFAVLLLVSLVACRGLLGGGSLMGGALLPAPGDVGDLWGTYTGAWHSIGTGSTQAAPPYLALVAIASSVLLGSTNLALTLLLVASVPLAGFAAYFASRPLVESRLLRAWGAVLYAFLPATAGALAGGRLGTCVLAIALPLMARAAVAATGLTAKPGNRPSWRAAWSYALALTVTTAFTPVVWPIALLLAVITLAGRAVRGRKALLVPQLLRFLAVLGTPMVVLAPWSLTLLSHPATFLREAGLPYRGGQAGALDLLALSPGGPKAATGLLFAGIVLAALGALLRGDRRRAVLAAWIVALTGLLAAAVQNNTAWAGPTTLIAGLALIAAAAVGAEGARERISASGFGWRQPVAGLIVIATAIAPVVAAFTWMIGGAAGPLQRRDPAQVPAFVADVSDTGAQPRTLVLDGVPGHVRYTLIRGAGNELGAAEITAETGDSSSLDSVVANLVAGSGADQSSRLGGYDIAYVLLEPGAPADMNRVLDTTPGLSRLSQTGGSEVWQVGTSASRVTITAPQGTTGTAANPVPVDSGRVEAHTTVPAGPAGRTLRIADAAAPGWHATLNGSPLAPTTVDGWSQGFDLPAAGGRLDLTYDSPLTHTAWLVLQGFLALVAVVMALPGRRSEADDDLPEEAAAAAAGFAEAAPDGDGRRARRLRAAAEAEVAAQAEAGTGPDDAAPAPHEPPPAAPDDVPPADPADPGTGEQPVVPQQGVSHDGVPEQPAVPHQHVPQQGYDEWNNAYGYPQQPAEYAGYPAPGQDAGQYPVAQDYGTGEYPAANGYPADAYGTGEYPAATGTGEYPAAQDYGTGEYPAANGYPAGTYGTGEYPAQDYGTGEYPAAQDYGTGEYPAQDYGTGEYPAGQYPPYQQGAEYTDQYGYPQQPQQPQPPAYDPAYDPAYGEGNEQQ